MGRSSVVAGAERGALYHGRRSAAGPAAGGHVRQVNATAAGALAADGALGALGGLAFDGALRYRPQRLWLDGRPRGEIAFVGRLMTLPAGRGRLLCAEALAALLAPGMARPLALPWQTPLRLGQARVMVTPAGSGPGSALLRLESDAATVLIATAARPAAPLAGPALELGPPVDVIAVDAQGATDAALAFGEAAALGRLASLRLRAGGGAAWVAVDDAGLMLALARLAARQGPVRLLGRWHVLGRRLGSEGRLLSAGPGARRRDVLQFCTHRRLASLGPAGQPHLVVGADQAPVRRGGQEPWTVDWRPSLDELAAMVIASGARQVVALGAGAAALAGRLAPRGIAVHAVNAPHQLSLW